MQNALPDLSCTNPLFANAQSAMRAEKPRSKRPAQLAKACSEVAPRRAAPRRLLRAASALPVPLSRAMPRVARSLRTILRATSKRRLRAPLRQLFSFVLAVVILLILYQSPPEPLPVSSEVSRDVVVRERIAAIQEELRRSARPPTPKPSPRPRQRGWRKGTRRPRPRRLGMGIHQVTERFPPVDVVQHVEHLQLGTFPDVRRIGISSVAVLPAEANRFDTPWLLPDRVETLPMESSGHRVLYSSIRDKGSDGIGHGLTVLNAELSTALSLGLSYTHRVGIYGSISRDSPLAIESLFGWGVDELPRSLIQREVCVIELISHRNAPAAEDQCHVCRGLREKRELAVDSLVEIPYGLSYGCMSCQTRQVAVMHYLRKNNKNHTLFQMSPEHCDGSPKLPDFGLSRGFFYWKYWDQHSNASLGRMPKVSRTRSTLRGWTANLQKRGPVRLDEGELTIAVHARRGDFFSEKHREMVSWKAFSRVIRQAMEAIHAVGGVYGALPVAVVVYSEGRLVRGATGSPHDVRQMDREFMDADGSVRDAGWLHGALVRGDARGNRTHSSRAVGGPFRAGVRVELRVSRDVTESFHEMASADVFVGSASDLSQYAVRVVARAGVVLLPKYGGGVSGCCVVRFHARSGAVSWKKRLVEFWRMFAYANEKSVGRAAVERERKEALEAGERSSLALQL